MICAHCNHALRCVFQGITKTIFWTVLIIFGLYALFAIGITLLEVVINSPFAIDVLNISDDSLEKIREFLDTIGVMSKKILPQERS